jgi:hypothetical protein
MLGLVIADADGESSNGQLRHRRTTVLVRTSKVLRMTSFLRPTPVYLAVALSIVLTAAVARADLGDCGQPRTSGQKATATDCLFLLQFAVGTQEFDRPCICDLDRSGVATATDALMCLRIAVG